MTISMIGPSHVPSLAGNGKPPLIVDVRTEAEFDAVHAAGALSMPLDRLDPQAVSQLRQGDEPICVICQSGARAAKACERFAESAIGPVYCIEGGTAAWVQAGLPVERGERASISLERQVRIAAGLLVLLGVLLTVLVHPYLIVLPALVGAGLVFAGVTDFCGMALLLAKMPWNQRANSACATSKSPPAPC